MSDCSLHLPVNLISLSITALILTFALNFLVTTTDFVCPTRPTHVSAFCNCSGSMWRQPDQHPVMSLAFVTSFSNYTYCHTKKTQHEAIWQQSLEWHTHDWLTRGFCLWCRCMSWSFKSFNLFLGRHRRSCGKVRVESYVSQLPNQLMRFSQRSRTAVLPQFND